MLPLETPDPCVFCIGEPKEEATVYAEYARANPLSGQVDIEAGLMCAACLDYHRFVAEHQPTQHGFRWIALENVELSCGTPSRVIDWSQGQRAGNQALFQAPLLPVLMDRIQYCREVEETLIHLAVQMYLNGDVTDENLWRALSGERVPVHIARAIYERLGFVPFARFPLKKIEEDRTPCLA